MREWVKWDAQMTRKRERTIKRWSQGHSRPQLWLKIGTGSQLHQYSASLHWYTICLSYHYPHSSHKRTICIILIQHTYKSLVSYHPHTLSWPSPIHYVSLTVIETDPLNVLEHREHHDVQFISTHVGHVVTETVTWTESGRGTDQRGWVSLSIGSVMILGQGEGGGEGRNGEAHHFHVEHSVLLSDITRCLHCSFYIQVK